MRTKKEYDNILFLYKKGRNFSQISRKLNISRTTIRDFIKKVKKLGKRNYYESDRAIKSCLFHSKIIKASPKKNVKLQKEYSYLLGMFLGDGCLSKGKRGVYRIRVTLDAKYPNIIDKVKRCISIIMPYNRVSIVDRPYKGKPSCVDVSCYSKQWVKLFPFYQPGPKWKYDIKLTSWQKSIVKKYPKEFWTGLFHSDGSRYKQTNANRYYYNFVQKSTSITNLFSWCSDLLNITYRISDYKTHYKVMIYDRSSTDFLDTFANRKT